MFVSHSLVCGCASVARWLVMWMKWPCSCHLVIVSTAPGYGSAASTCSGRWVSCTQSFSCSVVRRSIAHVACESYGRSTSKRRLAISAS